MVLHLHITVRLRDSLSCLPRHQFNPFEYVQPILLADNLLPASCSRPYTLHSLRKSYSCSLPADGVPGDVTAMVVGHAAAAAAGVHVDANAEFYQDRLLHTLAVVMRLSYTMAYTSYVHPRDGYARFSPVLKPCRARPKSLSRALLSRRLRGGSLPSGYADTCTWQDSMYPVFLVGA